MTPSGYNITELLHPELWVSCFLRSFVCRCDKSCWHWQVQLFGPKHPLALPSSHSQVHKVIKCIYPGPILLKKPMSGRSERCLLTEGPLKVSSPFLPSLDSQKHTRDTRTHPDARRKESLSQNANISWNPIKTKGGLQRPLRICELHYHSSKKFCEFIVPQQSPQTSHSPHSQAVWLVAYLLIHIVTQVLNFQTAPSLCMHIC